MASTQSLSPRDGTKGQRGPSPKGSFDSSATTVQEEDDCRRLYKAIVAGISFRNVSEDSPITIEKGRTVLDVLNEGPTAILGGNEHQIRWIHLPANNMEWVARLMDRLHEDEMQHSSDASDADQELTRFDRVLRNDCWKEVFRGRDSTAIHGRFMSPFAWRYSSISSEDPESDASDSKRLEANVAVLFMPYLHWEMYTSWKHRQRHIARIKRCRTNKTECNCLEDVSMSDYDRKEALLLHQYLYHRSPLHDRRSLDQSYFYNLRNVEHHDETQVVGLHTWDRSDPQCTKRKVMMTDQLWMWVINDDTVVTACPQTGTKHPDEASISDRLCKNLPQAVQQGRVKSMHGLMALIVEHCTNVFHRNDAAEDLAFFNFFADEIGHARSKVEHMLDRFHDTSKTIEQLWQTESSVVRMSIGLESLFSIKAEIELMAEIQKIVSDLDKIDFLCGQQEDVVQGLIKNCRTSRSLNDLADTLKTRRNSWSGMLATAKSTRHSLLNLLDLKQRQAAVSEARTVRYQIELTAKQGRSIMLLTVFTVFFLPISVMATIFSMNVHEFNDTKMTLRQTGAITLPTTIALIFGALCFAFTKEMKDSFNVIWNGTVRKLVGTGSKTGAAV